MITKREFVAGGMSTAIAVATMVSAVKAMDVETELRVHYEAVGPDRCYAYGMCPYKMFLTNIQPFYEKLNYTIHILGFNEETAT